MEAADSVLSVMIVTIGSLGAVGWFLLQIVREAEQRKKEMRDCDIW